MKKILAFIVALVTFDFSDCLLGMEAGNPLSPSVGVEVFPYR